MSVPASANDRSLVELIMANLEHVLNNEPWLPGGVMMEAPNEDEEFGKGDKFPKAWCFETEEELNYGVLGAGIVKVYLPVTTDIVYEFDAKRKGQGLRTLGRRYLAKAQRAIMADPGRGMFPGVANQTNAKSTLETGSLITELAHTGYGLVHLEHRIEYNRAFDDPTRQQPVRLPTTL